MYAEALLADGCRALAAFAFADDGDVSDVVREAAAALSLGDEDDADGEPRPPGDEEDDPDPDNLMNGAIVAAMRAARASADVQLQARVAAPLAFRLSASQCAPSCHAAWTRVDQSGESRQA